jgi:hypothetical protein
MKLIEDCLRTMVPGHWVTEVEGNEWGCYVLAYPCANSRHTLVLGTWVALLDGADSANVDSFASYADMQQVLSSSISSPSGLAGNLCDVVFIRRHFKAPLFSGGSGKQARRAKHVI